MCLMTIADSSVEGMTEIINSAFAFAFTRAFVKQAAIRKRFKRSEHVIALYDDRGSMQVWYDHEGKKWLIVGNAWADDLPQYVVDAVHLKLRHTHGDRPVFFINECYRRALAA